MKGLSTWKLIENSLLSAAPVMLLYVLESKGSSPGREGFFMAVAADDPGAAFQLSGSIGGGIMEYKLVELAKEYLQTRQTGPGIIKQVHRKDVGSDQSGMICSGEQTVLLYRVREKDLEAVRSIIRSLEESRTGTLALSPSGIGFVDEQPSEPFFYSFKSATDWLYREMTGYRYRLYIIGGGHCATALSTLMRSLDFYVIIYDDRPDLHAAQKNEMANEIHFLNDYTELKKLVTPGADHYVVIMTMGYRTDEIAITGLAEKEFGFIGLLGSGSKIEKMMMDLQDRGINASWLQKIQAPVGLPIHSQTPGEIAVSIAAAIIQAKNQ